MYMDMPGCRQDDIGARAERGVRRCATAMRA